MTGSLGDTRKPEPGRSRSWSKTKVTITTLAIVTSASAKDERGATSASNRDVAGAGVARIDGIDAFVAGDCPQKPLVVDSFQPTHDDAGPHVRQPRRSRADRRPTPPSMPAKTGEPSGSGTCATRPRPDRRRAASTAPPPPPVTGDPGHRHRRRPATGRRVGPALHRRRARERSRPPRCRGRVAGRCVARRRRNRPVRSESPSRSAAARATHLPRGSRPASCPGARRRPPTPRIRPSVTPSGRRARIASAPTSSGEVTDRLKSQLAAQTIRALDEHVSKPTLLQDMSGRQTRRCRRRRLPRAAPEWTKSTNRASASGSVSGRTPCPRLNT